MYPIAKRMHKWGMAQTFNAGPFCSIPGVGDQGSRQTAIHIVEVEYYHASSGGNTLSCQAKQQNKIKGLFSCALSWALTRC